MVKLFPLVFALTSKCQIYMSYFDKLVNKLFPDKKTPGGAADVHEVLKRSERDQKQYQQWKNSAEQKALLQELAQAYYYKKTNIRSDIEIHLFNTAYANGFAITYHPKISPKSFQHLFEYFKDKVMDMQYRLIMSDRRILDREDYVETIEKYYLKPPFDAQAASQKMIDQQYGNIVIEYIFIDDKPSYIKLLASIYSDSLYNEALSYDEFMSRLFDAQ